MCRNEWSSSTGMGGPLGPESVDLFSRNTVLVVEHVLESGPPRDVEY